MGDEVRLPLRHFLISCSFSPTARIIASQGLTLARLLGARVSFCFAGADDQHTRGQLRKVLDSIGAQSDVELFIEQGQPYKVLSIVAKTIGADLIVAGALSHESSLVGIFGSVSRRLVRQASCSVLLLTADSARPMPIHALGIEVDYKNTPKSLFVLALALVRAQQIPLHIIHENDYHLHFLELERIGDERRIQAYEKECQVIEQERLASYTKQFGHEGVDIKHACLRSDEGSALSTYCAKHDIGMVLLSAPNKPMLWWQRFFNPPAEIILQDLPCSILFYRA